MRVVFFSTCSSDKKDLIKYTYTPKACVQWTAMAQKHPDDEIILVTGHDANCVVDFSEGEEFSKSELVKYVVVPNLGTNAMADAVEAEKPDIAVAVSTVNSPIDWNPVKDALVAKELNKRGIKAFAHDPEIAMDLTDKWRTNVLLRKHGIGVANAVVVQSELFNAKSPTMTNNVYREYIFDALADMNFPVVIKTTAGMGSMGVNVVDTLEEACKTLESNESGDIIVEEKLPGLQFGTEIEGSNGNYTVMPPFRFRTNEKGVTDSFRIVKFGPIADEKYNVKQLQTALTQLAIDCKFEGPTQVDLAFNEGKWSVIEINPRWSGITEISAFAQQRRPIEIFGEAAFGKEKDYGDIKNLKFVASFKVGPDYMPIMEKLTGDEHICLLTAGESPLIRGGKFGEVIYGAFDTKEELTESLEKTLAAFPKEYADDILEAVKSLD